MIKKKEFQIQNDLKKQDFKIQTILNFLYKNCYTSYTNCVIYFAEKNLKLLIQKIT